MKSFVTQEYKALTEALQEIALTSENMLQKAERSCQVIRESIERLRGGILEYTFEDAQEEIRFFKEIKPQFLKELIYYIEVYEIEANRPIGDKKILKAYYKQISERLRLFFERNRAFYLYYKTGKTRRDEQYFLREAAGLPLTTEYLPEMDHRFCTVHSYKLGKLQAYEQLGAYLENALSLLEHPPSPEPAEKNARRPLTWTGSKAQFIELAYALQSFGAFNKGKVNVKQVIQYLEYCFNINTTNYYGAFQTMRIRKKNRAMFLDTLKDYLIRRMDESDEFPRMS